MDLIMQQAVLNLVVRWSVCIIHNNVLAVTQEIW